MLDTSIASALTYTEHGLHHYGYVTDNDLQIRFVRNATVTRRAYHADRAFSGAVYDSAGQLILASQRHNAGDIVPVDPAGIDAQDRELARAQRVRSALYGGILFPILGHFLVESMSRLWPLLALKPRDPPLVCFHHWPCLEMDEIFANPLYVAILRAFGLARENVLLIDGGCVFDTLLLPDPASRYHIDLNTTMGAVADFVSAAVVQPRSGEATSPYIYLSRSRWGENARIRNEVAVDEWAESRGVRVVHPQLTPPGVLLRLLTEAETVVASDGSHAHLTLFCRPGTRVLMLDTRPVPTQFALAKLRACRTVHLPLFDSPVYDCEQRQIDPQALTPLLDVALAQVAG